MTKLIFAAAAIGLFAAASPAAAAIIKPTGAAASSSFSSGYLPTFTIDGSGLSGGGLDPSEEHATYVPGNHWTSAAGNPVGQWIDWTFSAPQTLGAAYIWNHRSNGVAANPNYEPTLFNLTLFDAAGGVLGSFVNVSLLPDVASAQRIDFALTANVSRVRFDVLQTQGSTPYTGLAEVAFDTQSFAGAVPEPASWAMMIGGFGLIGGTLRRRAPASTIPC